MFENMKPERPLYYFEKIASIPHGSGNTKAISDYVVSVAKENGLKYVQDDMNNVIIYKNAYPGYENCPTVLMQGHLDMVCEKEPDCGIDFLKDGLELEIFEENNGKKTTKFLSAKGTTLGADDGVAVCYMLAVLENKEIKSPALECVFTVDEEVGMLGADKLDLTGLKGTVMINIDHGQQDTFLVGCAGGVTAECHLPVKRAAEEKKENTSVFVLEIGGLVGGHSGEEIIKQRASSNVLLGRVMHELMSEYAIGVISLEGGSKDNAIPRYSKAVLLIRDSDADKVNETLCKLSGHISYEFATTDPDMFISLHKSDNDKNTDLRCAMTDESAKAVVAALYCLPNGIQRMSTDIEGLVQTSLNMGILKTSDDEVTYDFSVRSSLSSEKEELNGRLKALMEVLGGTVTFSGDYPAWEYKKDSKLQSLMSKLYREMFGKDPSIETIHAGLECGIFSDGLKGLDCVSIGPNMFDIHTYSERLDLDSFRETYEYLLALLERIS